MATQSGAPAALNDGKCNGKREIEWPRCHRPSNISVFRRKLLCRSGVHCGKCRKFSQFSVVSNRFQESDVSIESTRLAEENKATGVIIKIPNVNCTYTLSFTKYSSLVEQLSAKFME
jgi:hypothetical protein